MTTASSPDQRFADLLDAAARFHPEAWDGWIDDFRESNQDPNEEFREHAARVKHQLRQALNGNDDGLDYDELWRRSETYLGSDYIFLRVMWVSFYPTEPIPGPPRAPFDAAITIGEIYYSNASDPNDNTGHPDQLKAHLALPPTDQGPLLRAVKTDLALTIAGATNHMPRRGLRGHVYGPPGMNGDDGIARALWHDLFADDPIPGEEQYGPAGQRTDLWPGS